MKVLKVKCKNKKIYSYTYNSFNDDIRDFDVYIDYLNKNFKKLDFTKVDKFVNYIYDIIDGMDYVFIEGLEDNELEFYKNNLKYVYYDKMIICRNGSSEIFTNYLFEIIDKKSKKILKDNIKFNLCNEYQDVIVVNTDRKYILNDDSRGPKINEDLKPYYYNRYYFIRDGYLQLMFDQRDGYIYDYRDIDELYFLKRKNLEIENKNYNTYDYKLFSNDINDDKYINYIYDIIDNVNYIFINRLPYNEECSYKDKLNYTYYDKILLEDKSKDFNTNYIFDIKDNKSKEVIKNNISFNLSDKDRNPIIVDTDKKYILNEIGKEEYEYIDYGFIKDDTLLAVLHQKDGFIDDYRSINVRKKIK